MNLTRREFIALCSSSALAAFLAACGLPPTPAPTARLVPTAAPSATILVYRDEVQFETVIGAKIDSQLQMVTTHKQYQVPQTVGFQIINHKTIPVYFEDYSFGVRAYVYDKQLLAWSRLPLMFRLLSKEHVTLYPGQRELADSSFMFGASTIPVAGKIRLVGIGWTDPNNPKNSMVATYTEIEIIQ